MHNLHNSFLLQILIPLTGFHIPFPVTACISSCTLFAAITAFKSKSACRSKNPPLTVISPPVSLHRRLQTVFYHIDLIA